MYKIVNGTAYHIETPNEVINILEKARNNRWRIRIFYGDPKTGKDWMEEHDVIGYIGRSAGKVKIPLLIANSRSLGGGAILDHCIVKMTVNRKTIYQHPNYSLGQLEIRKEDKTHPYAVYCDNKNIAFFKTEKQAQSYILFLQGATNKK